MFLKHVEVVEKNYKWPLPSSAILWFKNVKWKKSQIKKKTVEPLNKKTHYKRRVYNCFSLKLHKNISPQLVTRRNQRQEINKKNESVSLSTKLGNYMLLCVKEKLWNWSDCFSGYKLKPLNQIYKFLLGSKTLQMHPEKGTVLPGSRFSQSITIIQKNNSSAKF